MRTIYFNTDKYALYNIDHVAIYKNTGTASTQDRERNGIHGKDK